MLDILLPVILLAAILVAVHSYFGIRIIQRGIIFTDLAIGQIAAIGSSISVAYFNAEYLYFFTLGFALLASFIISYVVNRVKDVEAFIGLLYVLGASGVMLILTGSAEGIEHFNQLLASDILFTPMEVIVQSSIIYAVIGVVIIWVLPRVKGSSFELLFFLLLALSVTLSVQLAGVFVVFTLLVAPALIGLSLAPKRSYSVALFSGVLFSTVSIVISFYFDLPTGYSLVFLGALCALCIQLIKMKHKQI